VSLIHSLEACRLTGATYRELDYWTQCGYIAPSATDGNPGSGNRRLWAPEDVRRVRLMVRAVRSGLAPAVAARVADGEREIGPGVLVSIEGQATP